MSVWRDDRAYEGPRLGRVEPRFFEGTDRWPAGVKSPPPRRPTASPPDVEFLLRHGIPENIVHLATSLAAARGTPAREELLGIGFDAVRYWSLLAEELGLSFAETLSAAEPHPGAPTLAGDAVRRASAVFVSLDGLMRLAVAPEPGGIGSLADRLHRNPGMADRLIVPPAEIRRFLVAHSSAEIARRAVGGLAERLPELSARHIGVTRRSRGAIALFGASLVLVLVAPGLALWLLAALMSVFFLNCVLWKLGAALGAPRPQRCEAVPDAVLPAYSVLVPLYREAGVLADLVEHLARLDYPALCSKSTKLAAA